MSQETVAAKEMLSRFAEWQGRAPESVVADTTYGNGKFLQWLSDRNITPYMRTRDSIHRKNSPFFRPERFTYEPEHNRYICPAGQPLNYGGRVYRNHAFNYIGTRETLRRVCAKSAMHQRPFPLSYHSSERSRPATRPGLSEHARVRPRPAAKKEGGSAVRGTQEPDRTTSPASA